MRATVHNVLSEIGAERERQIDVEGRTPEHDDHHNKGQMAFAAAAYAVFIRHTAGRLWPWASKWWKPGDHRRNCVKAAALLVAEIERLDRAEGRRLIAAPRVPHTPTHA